MSRANPIRHVTNLVTHATNLATLAINHVIHATNLTILVISQATLAINQTALAINQVTAIAKGKGIDILVTRIAIVVTTQAAMEDHETHIILHTQHMKDMAVMTVMMIEADHPLRLLSSPNRPARVKRVKSNLNREEDNC